MTKIKDYHHRIDVERQMRKDKLNPSIGIGLSMATSKTLNKTAKQLRQEKAAMKAAAKATKNK